MQSAKLFNHEIRSLHVSHSKKYPTDQESKLSILRISNTILPFETDNFHRNFQVFFQNGNTYFCRRDDTTLYNEAT